MGLFDKLKKKQRPQKNEHENPYMCLRQQALDIKPEDLTVKLDNNEQVYAAIVDMPATNGIATLACFFDGTVSLYLSGGGGILGAGQKHEEVRHAGCSFLLSAGQVLTYLTIADNFDLPKNQDANAYLLTGGAIYKAQFNMSKIDTYEKPIQFLNFLIQDTLNNLRENSMKSEEFKRHILREKDCIELKEATIKATINNAVQEIKTNLITKISIFTTDQGPFLDDMALAVFFPNCVIVVPSEHKDYQVFLFDQLGKEFGIDYEQVIKASTCSENGEFVLYTSDNEAAKEST